MYLPIQQTTKQYTFDKKLNIMNVQELLLELRACEEAREWAKGKSIEEIVNNCHRGDWLLWLSKKIDLPIKPLTLAKARCAKTVIHLMKDQRSIDAIEAAERFGLVEEMTLEDLKPFRNNDYAAYAAAAAADAAYAAYAAAAAAAADFAVDAAVDAAAAAKTKNQLQTADICRDILGKMIIDKVNELITANN